MGELEEVRQALRWIFAYRYDEVKNRAPIAQSVERDTCDIEARCSIHRGGFRLAITFQICYTARRYKGYYNMTEKEINEYIKSRMPCVMSALKLIREGLTVEEAEDAKQELLITMYKCILNYRPEYHTSLDCYVIVSMEKRAGRFVRDMHRGYRSRERGAESLSTARDNRTPMINLLEDNYGDFTDRLGASELVEYALNQLDKEVAGMLRLWADNHTLQYIGQVYGRSDELVRRRINSGLEEMKGIMGGTE